MIWIVFALLTAAAAFSILWPLSRPAPAAGEDAADVAFYRAQIVEIDAELARGAVAGEQAETAKALAARRLLAVAPEEVAVADSSTSRKIASVLALLILPCVALGLYTRIGKPDLPDMPLGARLQNPPAGNDLNAAIAKMEAHLAAHPEDGKALEILAPVYLRLGRLDDAVHARAEALRLLGETPQRRVKYAEALAYAADGVVTPEAVEQLERALALDPKEMEARYFLGLAAAQHDDVAKAREIWSAMASEMPEGSPARKAVEEKLAMLDAPEAGAPPTSAAEAVAAQPKDEQQKTIRAMVERLAGRLATQGGNAEEWARLIRAYKVLNEGDKAAQALADARKALASDAAGLKIIDQTANEMGLK